jgi:cellulose synthase/poly-beta-1,6-N-acetylglucosamine synthase-like glycosyltransferase
VDYYTCINAGFAAPAARRSFIKVVCFVANFIVRNNIRHGQICCANIYFERVFIFVYGGFIIFVWAFSGFYLCGRNILSVCERDCRENKIKIKRVELAILIFLKAYIVFIVILTIIYMVRHFVFTINRLCGEQRMCYQDIVQSDYPTISVVVPMHNEEKVAANILDLLIKLDYPKDKMDIIPINDHSTDNTKQILDKYAEKYSYIKPLHRYNMKRGKPAALNDALEISDKSIMVIFDADYLPPKGILKEMAVCFENPEVGAVMGRVVPVNTSKNILTRILDIERSGGYQIDQQARYNLLLIPQYGGTVGGFKRELCIQLGKFDPRFLTEDTDLTFRLYLNGWKVVYANRAECYEEVPEVWSVRARQMRRWARGHNQVMFRYLLPLLTSKKVSVREKIDGTLLLFVYSVPFFLLLGIIVSLALFFLGETQIFTNFALISIFTAGCSAFGNYAPFNQIGLACFLDGSTYRIRLLPLLVFNFYFNMYCASLGFLDSIIDLLTGRATLWAKTERFREKM